MTGWLLCSLTKTSFLLKYKTMILKLVNGGENEYVKHKNNLRRGQKYVKIRVWIVERLTWLCGLMLVVILLMDFYALYCEWTCWS